MSIHRSSRLVVVCGAPTMVSAAQAMVQTEVSTAVDGGTAWLVAEQSEDGARASNRMLQRQATSLQANEIAGVLKPVRKQTVSLAAGVIADIQSRLIGMQ